MTSVAKTTPVQAAEPEVAFKRVSVLRMLMSDTGSVIALTLVVLTLFCGLFAP